jgi:hypothetical protein
MKLTALYEAKANATYEPEYDDKTGFVRGAVDAWLEKWNISKDDVQEAIARVKQSSLVKQDFPAAGLEYENRPKTEKNGTLTFSVDRVFKGNTSYRYSYTGFYQVYANGQIRSAVGRLDQNENERSDTSFTQTPLRSPKPRNIEGDPVGTVEANMMAALEEVLRKWKKSLANLNRDK